LACAGVAALAFSLAACGSGGDKSGAAASSAPTTTTSADSAGESAGLTPPGAKLKLGQQAIVGWVPASLDTGQGAKKGSKLQITVQSIQKGKIADFKNVQLKPEEKTSTPYYVKVLIKSLTKNPPGGNNDPDVALDAVDDRGQKQSSIIFLGTFARCDNKQPPKSFTTGKSYSSCLAYLIPGGGSIQKVQWGNGPSKAGDVTPYFEKPIVWS